MAEAQIGSDTQNENCAKEIFHRVYRYIDKASNRGIVWDRCVPSTATSATDGLSHEESASRESEGIVQQHLISSVVFRWIGRRNGDEWELENIWDNVSVRQLDDIGQKPNYEWRPRNYSGQTMAENVNIVLLRTIVDWSREDGNVWSRQVAWSGSFEDGHRVLQLLEGNSNAANSIEMRGQRFYLHLHLRARYIALHGSYPLAAALAAVDSSPTVVIPVQSVGTGDGEVDIILCAICHDMLSTGDDAKRLPCNHLFHRNCIFQWFYSKLECPLCRNDFQSRIASMSPSF